MRVVSVTVGSTTRGAKIADDDGEEQLWQPFEVDKSQGVLVLYMQREEPVLKLASPPTGFPPRDQLARDFDVLRNAGIVLSDAKREEFTLAPGIELVFLPDGRTVVGDDSTGRLARWVMEQASAARRGK